MSSVSTTFCVSSGTPSRSNTANESISGLEKGGYVHKISLYADDIMLYLTNPKSSLPTLSKLLENFRDISGYKININKSVMMPLNLAAEKMPLNNIPFLWNSEKIVYL